MRGSYHERQGPTKFDRLKKGDAVIIKNSDKPAGEPVKVDQNVRVVTSNAIDVGKIMAFEDGQLSEDETIELFQGLVDSGMAWKLQGSYGRMAKGLIDAGLVLPQVTSIEVTSAK